MKFQKRQNSRDRNQINGCQRPGLAARAQRLFQNDHDEVFYGTIVVMNPGLVLVYCLEKGSILQHREEEPRWSPVDTLSWGYGVGKSRRGLRSCCPCGSAAWRWVWDPCWSLESKTGSGPGSRAKESEYKLEPTSYFCCIWLRSFRKYNSPASPLPPKSPSSFFLANSN